MIVDKRTVLRQLHHPPTNTGSVVHDGAKVIGYFEGVDVVPALLDEVVHPTSADVGVLDADVRVSIRPRLFVVKAQGVADLVSYPANLAG